MRLSDPTFSPTDGHQMSPAETSGGAWVPRCNFCLRPIHSRKRFTHSIITGDATGPTILGAADWSRVDDTGILSGADGVGVLAGDRGRRQNEQKERPP